MTIPLRVPGEIKCSEKQIKSYGSNLAPIINNTWSNDLIGKPTEPTRFDEKDLGEAIEVDCELNKVVDDILLIALLFNEKFSVKLILVILYSIKIKQ